MDMDTSQNWLGFSLSTHSLLDAFSVVPQHGGAEEGGGSGVREMAMLGTEEPKLEDFLGGCAEQGVRYSGGGDAAEPDGGAIYDSDLKIIAAGFLRGVPSEQHDPETSNKAAVPADSRKTVDTFGQRTSIYRGVTRHRWTGRYEAHLWDNSCRREGQSRKGRQVYLGGYDKEEKAARAYDLAALKYWGPTTSTNFPVSNYDKELEEMKNMTRQEFVASLRRKSSGFSRGASIYRGVTRHHQHGRWQARIGRVAGNKDLYLGTFSTQEEAAEAYDIAAIKFRGLNAVTNFDMSRYDIKSIMNSNLPIGGMSGKTSKASESSSSSSDTVSMDAKQHMENQDVASLGLSALPIKPDQDYWSFLAFQHQQQQQQQSSQVPGYGVYTSAVNLDFSTAASGGVVAQGNGGNFGWSNGVYQQQHQGQEQSQSSSCSSIPYATPLAVGGNYEGSTYVGSWVPSASSYYHQVAKPNVGFFQTPIYGME